MKPKVIYVKCKDEEYVRVEKLAASEYLSVSAYIRRLINKEYDRLKEGK